MRMTSSDWLDDVPAWERREVQNHLVRGSNEPPFLETEFGPKPLAEARAQRREGKPLEYILGHVHVAGLTLTVDERVLIPRPETETLVRRFVEEALPRLPDGPLLDCGTGSGFVASLLTTFQDRPVVALDRFAEPLSVAGINQAQIDCRYLLVQGDGLEPIRSESLAGVLANLPYVNQGDPRLDRSVELHEPPSALHPDGPPDRFYRRVFVQTRRALRPGGEAWFELSPVLQRRWEDRLRGGEFSQVEGLKDEAGRDRFLRLVR